MTALTPVTFTFTIPKPWMNLPEQRKGVKPLGGKLRKYARRLKRGWKVRTYPTLKARKPIGVFYKEVL